MNSDQLVVNTGNIMALAQELDSLKNNPSLLANKYLQAEKENKIYHASSKGKIITLPKRLIKKLGESIKDVLNNLSYDDFDFEDKVEEVKQENVIKSNKLEETKTKQEDIIRLNKLEEIKSEPVNSEKVAKVKKVKHRKTTSKNKLVTVPTFALNDIRIGLNEARIFLKEQVNNVVTNISDAITLNDEDIRLDNEELAEKLQKAEQKKIIKARKADFEALLKARDKEKRLMSLHTKRLERVRLKLARRQKISKAKAYLMSVSKNVMNDIKDFANYNYGKIYVNQLDKLAEKERIKSIKIADKLQEASQNEIRKQAMNDMIYALKEADRMKIEAQKEQMKQLTEERSNYLDTIKYSR